MANPSRAKRRKLSGCAPHMPSKKRFYAVGPENVAAIAAEPVQGAGGVKIAPDTYWPEVQKIVDKYGILLLADEVITGFGRLGRWFASRILRHPARPHHLRQSGDVGIHPALRRSRRRQDRRGADGA